MRKKVVVEELEACPHCGSLEGFYTRDYAQGTVFWRRGFVGQEGGHNEGAHDNLSYRQGKRAYCNKCEKYLGKIVTE